MAADTPGRDARAAAALGALEALIRSGEDLLGKSVALAPVEEGTLRGSAALTIIVNGSEYAGLGARSAARSAVKAAAHAGQPLRMDVEVRFTEVYAARQHEELDWNHPKGGQAKYLEHPFTQNVDRYSRLVELAAEAALRGA